MNDNVLNEINEMFKKTNIENIENIPTEKEKEFLRTMENGFLNMAAHFELLSNTLKELHAATQEEKSMDNFIKVMTLSNKVSYLLDRKLTEIAGVENFKF